ncbi:MAG: RNA methyltransferase [Clostridia bacterium]|nr:RNA methyltransferase [Clostridia bacterium]
MSKKKSREESGCFFVEGLRGVCDAVSAGAEVRHLVVSESFLDSALADELKNLKDSAETFTAESVLLPVSDSVYEYITETEAPQGIGAVIEMKTVTEISGTRLLLLENMQDPGNMGTVIRTADAAGFDGIICMRGCVDIYNPKVLRSTVGSMFHIPIIRRDSPEDTVSVVVAELKNDGYTLYAAHPRGGACCFDEDFRGKTVIVIGNEANGITEEMLNACDKLLTIPMPGKSESLNASVAAAIMMYETVRKRDKHI